MNYGSAKYSTAIAVPALTIQASNPGKKIRDIEKGFGHVVMSILRIRGLVSA